MAEVGCHKIYRLKLIYQTRSIITSSSLADGLGLVADLDHVEVLLRLVDLIHHSVLDVCIDLRCQLFLLLLAQSQGFALLGLVFAGLQFLIAWLLVVFESLDHLFFVINNK